MTSRQIQSVALGHLFPDPDQPRKHFDEAGLAGLGQSMEALGQLQPLLVYPHGDSLVIIDGERRYRAAVALGWERLDVIVQPEPAATSDALEASLVSGIQNESLRPLEVARGFLALVAMTKLPSSQLAQRLGCTPGKMSKLTALVALPAAVQQLIDAGELKPATAYEVSRLDDPGQQEQLAREAVRKKLTRDAVVRRVAAIKAGSGGPPKRRSARAARIEALLGGGRRITFTGGSLENVDDLLEWLDELVVRARKERKARPTLSLRVFLGMLRDELRGDNDAQGVLA